MKRSRKNIGGFTIIELLVVVSIIALLIGILLPAIGRARDRAQETQSASNLRQLAIAHANYGSEWNDNQWSTNDHNLAKYGNSYEEAMENWSIQTGFKGGLTLGWGGEQTVPPQNTVLIAPVGWVIANSGHLPIGGIAGGPNPDFGYFRMMNIGSFNTYLTGRWYDSVLFAPKDRSVIAAIGDCFDHPGEFCNPTGPLAGGTEITVYWSSYALSPAALFAPQVMSWEFWEENNSIWGNPGALRVPRYSHARYPDLKTHITEHHWLQNPKADCNPHFQPGSYNGCEPYYFNHGLDSAPQAAFYDGHVAGISVRAARIADQRSLTQAGEGGESNPSKGLWLRNTPFGMNGYFNNLGWPAGGWGGVEQQHGVLIQANTSFHILTRDGIRGRDLLVQN